MKQSPLSEKAIQQSVLDHWRKLGLPNTFVGAIPNAGALGQPGLTRGIFDLLVMVPGIGAAFLELKTDKGRVSPYQEQFKLACIAAGVTYAITYGRDEPIRVLEGWHVVRAA